MILETKTHNDKKAHCDLLISKEIERVTKPMLEIFNIAIDYINRNIEYKAISVDILQWEGSVYFTLKGQNDSKVYIEFYYDIEDGENEVFISYPKEKKIEDGENEVFISYFKEKKVCGSTYNMKDLTDSIFMDINERLSV